MFWTILWARIKYLTLDIKSPSGFHNLPLLAGTKGLNKIIHREYEKGYRAGFEFGRQQAQVKYVIGELGKGRHS